MNIIKIGTRKSKLAIAQAIETKDKILSIYPDLNIELVRIDTTGDKIQDRNLADIGGKGLFTQEIEEKLFDGSIDIAVHSMKDMTDTLPDGLIIDCILEREDPHDAFISNIAKTITDLPRGAIVGTSSIRRKIQLLKIRPDLQILPFRGNVITRMEKLDRGDVDATFLAVAGLKRLGMGDRITSIVDHSIMIPAIAQGAIGIECSESNTAMRKILSKINHEGSNVRVTAERGFLKSLGGSCSTPIGGLAEFQKDGSLYFCGFFADKDDNIHITDSIGNPKDAEKIGRSAGSKILL